MLQSFSETLSLSEALLLSEKFIEYLGKRLFKGKKEST